MSEVEDGSQRVVLYYTDAGMRMGTQEAASFKMGDLTGRWARFTLTVQGAEVGVSGSVDFSIKGVKTVKTELYILDSEFHLDTHLTALTH